jgi:hypothetical protein
MRWTVFSFALLLLTIPPIGGCNIDLGQLGELIGQIGNSNGDSGSTANEDAARLEDAVGTVQTADPYDASLPEELVDEGDAIIIDAGVDVIVDIEQDLPVIDLPDSTVVGFDNQTGWDIYVRFLADDVLQGVYVYDGETLLLDYPCLGAIELLTEDDIDPFTGTLVGSFNLEGLYVNPDDFICGDAVILPFEPETVYFTVEYIDLVD